MRISQLKKYIKVKLLVIIITSLMLTCIQSRAARPYLLWRKGSIYQERRKLVIEFINVVMNSHVFIKYVDFDYEYSLSANCVMQSEFHVIPSNNHTPLLHVRVHCHPVLSDSGFGIRYPGKTYSFQSEVTPLLDAPQINLLHSRSITQTHV